MTCAPEWVCEILSPGGGRRQRAVKPAIHFCERVPHLWIIDPSTRTLEVLRRTEAVWLFDATFGEDDVVRAPPFDAVEFVLGDLWPG